MSQRRLNLRERLNLRDRRRSLASKPAILRLESKSVISEPINLMTLTGGLSAGLALLSKIQAGTSIAQAMGAPTVPGPAKAAGALYGGARRAAPTGDPQSASLARGDSLLALTIVPQDRTSSGGNGGDQATGSAPENGPAASSQSAVGDWLTMTPSASASNAGPAISVPQAQPLPRRGGGDSVSHPAAAVSSRGAITPFRVPANPAAPVSSGASGALLSAIGLGSNPGGATSPPHSLPNVQAPAAASKSQVAPVAPAAGQAPKPLTSSALTLYTLDYNDGAVFVPGFDQLATPGGAVDLRAQVRDSATGTYTFSWSYGGSGGLSDATGISGGSTYDLTFHWNTTITVAKNESVTLTVTDPNLNVVSQTYTFQVPAGTGSTTGGTTWNDQELAPNLIQAAAPAIASQNVSVVANTGSLETSIALPTYNPNIAPVVLNYDSLAADPRPIVVAHHVLDPTKSTPSQVQADLTFNGSSGGTSYYNTSDLRPGDIQQIALQANATTLSTGRYAYTVNIYDIRSGIPTTFTYNDTATVVNEALDPTFSALGAGWTISGLNKIISASGGVILDEGSGLALWFTSGSGGSFTSPAGDFSTLSLSGGV